MEYPEFKPLPLHVVIICMLIPEVIFILDKEIEAWMLLAGFLGGLFFYYFVLLPILKFIDDLSAKAYNKIFSH